MRIDAEAVLFDMDGTLLDSSAALVRCWTRWAIEYGITEQQFARVTSHGRTSAAIVADLVPPEQVAAAHRRIEEIELTDTDGVIALPGAVSLIEALPSGRWAVVTSATRDLADVRLKAAGIEAPVLIGADDVVRGKPDPEPFLAGAAALGIAPEKCVVVEDAPAGITAARAAGMATIAVTTTHESAALADADLVVSTLERLHATVTADGVSFSPLSFRPE